MGCNVLISNSTSYTVDPRNPNPLLYEIKRINKVRSCVIAKIHYIGCTNYEGLKILMWRNVSVRTIKSRRRIDPHFTESNDLIARFPPTDEGWKMAVDLANIIG